MFGLEILAAAAVAVAGMAGLKVGMHGIYGAKVGQSLAGAVFAVSILTSEGVDSDLTDEVTNAILARGGRCVTVQRTAVQQALAGLDAFDRFGRCGADLFIGGTLIEEVIESERVRTAQNINFVAWARQRWPNRYNTASERIYDSGFGWTTEQNNQFAAICAAFYEETGQTAYLTVREAPTRKLVTSFRCHGADGSIVGAGSPEASCRKDRKEAIVRLAHAIVDRIHVRLDEVTGQMAIRVGEGPVVLRPIPAAATDALPQGQAASLASRPPRPEDDRPHPARRTSRLEDET